MYSELDIETMALTTWAEARGENTLGQRAVIWVCRNRLSQPGWWSRNKDGIPDDTLAAVCRDPWQFSCWNPSDPNRYRLDNPKTKERPDYQKIRELVIATLNEVDTDPTYGADHYCTTKIASYTKWAKGRKPIVVIGNHSFYKIGLNP